MSTLLRPLRILIAVAAFCFAGESSAKDLSNRLGVGFKNQTGIDIPGIAVQYYPSTDLAFGAELAVDTAKDASKFAFLAKVHKVIFKEDNLNFYMGVGGGLVSQEVPTETGTDTETDSGFELLGVLGCEFFFAGLENLGFSFETGAGVTSISSGVRFRTIGDSPVRAGILFYF